MFRIFSRKHHSSFLIRQSLGATVVAQRGKEKRRKNFVIYMELWGLVGKLDH